MIFSACARRGSVLISARPLPPRRASNTSSASKGPVWVEIMEAESGNMMFANIETGDAQWERPEGIEVYVRPAPQQQLAQFRPLYPVVSHPRV